MQGPSQSPSLKACSRFFCKSFGCNQVSWRGGRHRVSFRRVADSGSSQHHHLLQLHQRQDSVCDQEETCCIYVYLCVPTDSKHFLLRMYHFHLTFNFRVSLSESLYVKTSSTESQSYAPNAPMQALRHKEMPSVPWTCALRKQRVKHTVSGRAKWIGIATGTRN